MAPRARISRRASQPIESVGRLPRQTAPRRAARGSASRRSGRLMSDTSARSGMDSEAVGMPAPKSIVNSAKRSAAAINQLR